MLGPFWYTTPWVSNPPPLFSSKATLLGGYEGKKEFVYLQWASHFLALHSRFFPRGKCFLGFQGGWVLINLPIYPPLLSKWLVLIIPWPYPSSALLVLTGPW